MDMDLDSIMEAMQSANSLEASVGFGFHVPIGERATASGSSEPSSAHHHGASFHDEAALALQFAESLARAHGTAFHLLIGHDGASAPAGGSDTPMPYDLDSDLSSIISFGMLQEMQPTGTHAPYIYMSDLAPAA